MLNITRKLLLIAVLILLPTLLHADGKMYSKYAREEVNTEIPYQRAAIIYADGVETMVLQSKYGYETRYPEEPADIADLAWVVPVPSVPELASMGDDVRFLFNQLNSYTQTKVTIILEEIVKYSLLIFLPTAIIMSFCLLANRKNTESWFYKHSASTTNIIAGLLIILILSAISMPTLGRAKGSAGTEVEILRSAKVGIYDTKVIRSDSPDALITWLNDNGFKFNDSDLNAFSSYINKGWCFVVAKVSAKANIIKNNNAILLNGLPAPLIMRFATAEPVYPMALTGTGGFYTEVLVYLLADKKMTCNSLELRYATKGWNKNRINFSNYKTDPVNFALDVPEGNFWIMRFKSTLIPEQMQEDVIFKPALDQTTYREHIVKFR